MMFGILVMFIALCISAVAIYYSVAGLVAIFAAAAVPIIIMGGVLEVGKLVTAVWLHRFWDKAAWWMKFYLSIAVVVLMFITSMGIFGFLSKAHIEQTTASLETVEQVARLETEIARQESIIVRAEQKIVKAESSTGNLNEDIQAQIDKEQTRIDSAYTRIEPAIAEQNTIIQTQLDTMDSRVAVYEDEITALDKELQRLNNLVSELRSDLTNTTVASIEQQVQPYLDQIAQLDTDLDRINTQANEYEARISAVEADNSAVESLQKQIANIEQSIVVTTNKLQSTERAKIQEGQAVIGVTNDGLFGSNTRRALTTWVEAQQQRISDLQSQETQLRTQAQSVVEVERTRLTDLVKDLRGAQTTAIQDRKQGLLEAIDTVRAGAIDVAKQSKQSIQTKIDAVLNTDIPANRSSRQVAQEQITKLRQADDPRINAARDTIKQLREGADAQIAASNNLIQRLRDRIKVDGGANVDAIIDDQQQRIVDANNLIDTMTEEKYAIEAEYRKLEAEVGPIKYIAEFIYDETDKDVLEEAVRWVIITIIFVFDPLAVMLLIAAQYTFEWRRNEKDETVNETIEPEKAIEPKKAEEVIQEDEQDELAVLLDKAEPEVLEEVAKELEKEVDNIQYDPYTDNRDDSELSAQELSQRHNMKLYSSDGRLAGTGKTIKSIKMKKE
tara:strand:+ start:2040 stop:4052 length:2013 start_codon:yes stop_codon:yes gene_type:complete